MDDRERTFDEIIERGGDRDAISERYKEAAPDHLRVDFSEFVATVRNGDHSIEYLAAIADKLDELERQARDDEFVVKTNEWKNVYQKPLIHEYAFAIPNREALDYIATHDPVVELGAWNGYWAYELDSTGADIDAYDIDPPAPKEQWYPVETGDQDVLIDYGSETALLLCWPPAGDMGYESLLLHDGDVLYVGELPGDGFKGFADMRFFDVLESNYTHVETVEIPSHPGCKDNLHYFQPTQ